MIDRTSLYGCLVLQALDRQNSSNAHIPIARLSDWTRVPRPYLAKVCQALERAGLVDTRRGAGGGVRITPVGSQATAMQVASALSDTLRWRRCVFGHPGDCTDARCSPWQAMVDEVEDILSGIRLSTPRPVLASTGVDEGTAHE